MTKLTLTDLANLQNENTAVVAINANNAATETALENTLSRDGTSPNTMNANLDMNSNRIINLPAPIGDNDPVRYSDVTSILETAGALEGNLSAFALSLVAATSASAAKTVLGVGTGDSPQFTAVNIGNASDTTVSRASAGDIAVEGNTVYRAGGTDVAVADGGTGSSTAAAARTALGVYAATRSFDTGMFNGKLAATVAASALTVSVKTLAGADPSSGDPVYIVFRGDADTDGDFDVLTITAALSVTVSSGSTTGFVANVPGRLWVVAFNDSGTVRLGVTNFKNTASQIVPLREMNRASSTAEGGAGAADSSGVFYTTTAVSSKPFRLLGYLTWETALATPGTWSAGPDIITLFGPGIKKPGELVQVARNSVATSSTGTTVIPLDNTVPQSSEGDQYLSTALLPMSGANVLQVNGDVSFACSAAVHCISAIFRDAAASADSARAVKVPAVNNIVECIVRARYTALAVASTTFTLRIGPESAGTITLNGQGGSQLFNGVGLSRLEVEEYMC